MTRKQKKIREHKTKYINTKPQTQKRQKSFKKGISAGSELVNAFLLLLNSNDHGGSY